MKLPEELKRAGVVGTGTGNADDVLRDIAIYSLQHRAGYMPKILPESAYMRKINDERPVTPTQSTSQLYRMLLGDFQFAGCLPEWCLLVAENGMRMPGELIPSMLDSDLIFRDWQGLILMAMGSYARWIVAHETNKIRWKWVKETPPPRLAHIYKEIDSRSNNFIANYETARDKVNFHRQLGGLRYFWSDKLAEYALDYIDFVLRNKPFDQWRIDMERFTESFAYYAPLKYHPPYSEYLKIINRKYSGDFDINMITGYRRKLRHIITEDARRLQNKGGV